MPVHHPLRPEPNRLSASRPRRLGAVRPWRRARDAGGRFLLRLEDIDPDPLPAPPTPRRSRRTWAWLGLTWDGPVRVQSEHMEEYQAVLDRGWRAERLLYPCFCTRADILREVADSAAAPQGAGPDGSLVYPGTCRNLDPGERARRLRQNEGANWRLDVAKAFAMTGPLYWSDRAAGRIEAAPLDFGDVVLARKDVPTSYHLSVTVDDHLQHVTLVTRGKDLCRATDIHRLLQALLGYATPDYHHHELLTDATGRRLAKRDRDVTLRALRAAGRTATEVRAMACFAAQAPVSLPQMSSLAQDKVEQLCMSLGRMSAVPLARFLLGSLHRRFPAAFAVWSGPLNDGLPAPEGCRNMPLYTYHCKECDKDVELLVRSTETPACPACGAQGLERLMSRPVGTRQECRDRQSGACSGCARRPS